MVLYMQKMKKMKVKVWVLMFEEWEYVFLLSEVVVVVVVVKWWDVEQSFEFGEYFVWVKNVFLEKFFGVWVKENCGFMVCFVCLYIVVYVYL